MALGVGSSICCRQLAFVLRPRLARRLLRRRHVAPRARQLPLPPLQLAQQRAVVHKGRHGRQALRLLNEACHGAAHIWHAFKRQSFGKRGDGRLMGRLRLRQRRLRDRNSRAGVQYVSSC